MSETPVRITVDGSEVQAASGQLLIDACEQVGTYIPRFCYHPRMRPVGMCRMCLVDVDVGRGPALAPSCMLTVSEGMVVETASEAARKAQDGVLEFLLVNHPLDCPVCDKGGECPLQDQTMAYGPGESRFVEEKRHFDKPLPISDLVYLDRERCILCDRCTRFADEVAGEPLIGFMGRGYHTEVNTFPDRPFDSYFSGNTVQLCPVGALTARPYRFRARPWDLTELTSTYPNATGDRISLHASRNRLLRIQGVDSEAVNHGWLADRDRFSFEAVASPGRLQAPMLRSDGELVVASWSAALAAAAAAVGEALGGDGPASVAVVGGARLCAEDQYAWAKLAKGVIGTDNVDAQLGDGLPAEVVCALPRGTIADACAPGGVVLTIAGDLREEFGSLFLRLRGAVDSGAVTLAEMSPLAGSLTPLARCSLRVRPGDADVIAEAILDPPQGAALAGIATEDLRAVAALAAEHPLTVLVGRSSVAESAIPAAAAALRLAGGFPHARFLPLLRRGGAAGAIDAGLAPGLLPGRTTLESAGAHYGAAWGAVPSERGTDTAGILAAAAAGRIDVLFLIGADPLADFPDRELARRALERVATVVAVDTFATASVSCAEVVLPAVMFGERSGTHMNIEGRATAETQLVTPPPQCRRDWEIAAELALLLGSDLGIASPRQAWDELADLSPLHAGAGWDDVRADLDGMLLPVAAGSSAGNGGAPSPAGVGEPPSRLGLGDVQLPAAPAVAFDSYSYRLVADRRAYDAGTVLSNCPSLAGFARPAALRLNPRDFGRLGCGPDDLLRVTSPAGVVSVTATPDEAVPGAVAALTVNSGGVDPGELIDAESVVCEIRVEPPTS
ncbi:MAG: NADH-quinone oxidoreductase subunit NuoG [Acidimicrobiia bacterium]|nr:NADH-quinone oxidoreductase subunit NuoG [Acidimicrobiia bacterium]